MKKKKNIYLKKEYFAEFKIIQKLASIQQKYHSRQKK